MTAIYKGAGAAFLALGFYIYAEVMLAKLGDDYIRRDKEWNKK